MRPEEAEARRWLEKARHDWSVVQRIADDRGPELDVAGFHCQQAIEKILKAFLILHSHPFERIHDLGRLLDYCGGVDSSLESLRHGVEPISIFAVAFRYPGPADPTIEEIEQALMVVDDTWSAVTSRMPAEIVPS